MNALWWTLRDRGLAVPAALAVVLLAVVLVFEGRLLPTLQAELDALEARPAPARPTRAERPSPPAEQLKTFYRYFEGSGTLARQLKTLHRVAMDHGVAMPQGEYRLLEARDSSLQQYRITLPMHGTYPDVRRFVAAVLAEVPVAALDQVTFERRRIGDAAVQARVQFTLFLPVP